MYFLPPNARFYDGKQSTAHLVQVEHAHGRLIIHLETGPLEWSFSDVVLLSDTPETFTYAHHPDARLTLLDAQLFKELCAHLPCIRKEGAIIPVSWKILAITGVLSLLFLFFSYAWLRHTSAYLTSLIPITWEEKYGRQMLNTVLEEETLCNETEGYQALQKIIHALHPPFSPLIYVIEEDDVNAYAWPGNVIVLYSTLIEEAETPEELAGVIAHEMGHLLHRHNLKHLSQALLLETLHAVTLGGNQGQIPTGLLHLTYSKEQEIEADETAKQLLIEADIPLEGLRQFFRRLAQQEQKKYAHLFRYFSTHPSPLTRMEALQADKAVPHQKPLLRADEWEALKEICAHPLPRI